MADGSRVEETKPETAPATAQPAIAKPARRPAGLRRLLLVAGPLAVIVGGLYVYLTGGRYVSTDNAYVQADKLIVSTDISGIVAEVAVRNNQTVARGQVLFHLDDQPFRIALAGAKAQLAATRNQVAALQANYRQALAEIAQAETDVPFYQTAFQRQQDLSTRQVASAASFDQAKHDLDAAKEKVTVARSRAQGILAQLGGTADGAIEDNPTYRQAQAQVDRAQRDFDHTVVKASMAGIVTNVDALQVGAYLPAAQPAFNLVGSERVWVTANLKETDLTYLKPGDKADLFVDAYPNLDWKGAVRSISPASGAEFSVLPAQNSSGNWVKVVQRVAVVLAIDVPPGAPQLRTGMSAEVEIDSGHIRSLGDLVDGIRRAIGI